jgi:hypothetical protein
MYIKSHNTTITSQKGLLRIMNSKITTTNQKEWLKPIKNHLVSTNKKETCQLTKKRTINRIIINIQNLPWIDRHNSLLSVNRSTADSNSQREATSFNSAVLRKWTDKIEFRSGNMIHQSCFSADRVVEESLILTVLTSMKQYAERCSRKRERNSTPKTSELWQMSRKNWWKKER